MPQTSSATVASKIRHLANVASTLREGASFNITRLTTLKSLCEDPQAAARFAFHLAQLTYRQMPERADPKHLEPAQWEYYKQVVDEALRQMARYLEEPTKEESDLIQVWLTDVRRLQDRYEQQRWGPVRIIESREVLLIEQALSCLLYPANAADWGYHIAREYAERYNARYGTGLIPESAPMVEDIAEFWCQYYFGKPLHEWLGTS
jgi:hypothetical protein